MIHSVTVFHKSDLMLGWWKVGNLIWEIIQKLFHVLKQTEGDYKNTVGGRTEVLA